MQKVLISGGAGFVGSSLALAYRERFPRLSITVFDNLHRRGSERNLRIFRKQGIDFVHGDIRNPRDFDQLEGNFDWFIEASAEPSVLAGTKGSPAYLLETNLIGTLHALEFARERAPNFCFLSTSRVYSIAPLKALALDIHGKRFVPRDKQAVNGISALGINEEFPTDRARSLYGASKLASELLIQEYAEQFQLRAVINRCGVIAGPGQFGKVDQGVFTLWLANHFFGRDLAYFGYGGKGLQVRDLLHPLDLFELIEKQRDRIHSGAAPIFNVGGGNAGAVSLAEWTDIAREVSGRSVTIQPKMEVASVDIPFYSGDSSRAEREFSWRPSRSPRQIASDIYAWIQRDAEELKEIFGG